MPNISWREVWYPGKFNNNNFFYNILTMNHLDGKNQGCSKNLSNYLFQHDRR
jgi:hypothetical protein